MNIPSRRSPSPKSDTQRSRSLGTSYRSQYGERSMAAIAEESIARDLEDGEAEETLQDADSEHPFSIGEHSSLSLNRRPSYNASGPRPGLSLLPPNLGLRTDLNHREAVDEERDLLEDSNVLPRQPTQRKSSHGSNASASWLSRRISFPRRDTDLADEESAHGQTATETTALLNGTFADAEPLPYSDDTPDTIDKKWEDAVIAGRIHTTWQRELKVLARYSAPLTLTFILQQSLTVTSIFTVGHIGKNELGAVSLGGMTAAITGYAVYHGLATSLDTLCAQAYGSGRKKLVGLNLQRMVFFLWACTVPIVMVWVFSEQILMKLVPEERVAVLAGQYLRVLAIGAPAYACFESSKRFVQAQGLFAASMYVLLVAAPANALMHWLFVWHLSWGFIGCPIAIVVTEYLMVLLLYLYVRLVGGMECWPGFSRKAFKNWGPMVRLALPGFIMIIAEFMAFEILTFAAAQISATHLAANAVLQSLSGILYQLPWPMGIAGSTRVANLIGATLPDAAKVTTRVLFVLGTMIGLFNMILMFSLRSYIPYLFTSDPDVIALVTATLPVNAAFQLWDATSAQCNGVLRGLGKQSVGGYICLLVYYVVAIPISFGTAFGLGWELHGLWTGPLVALFLQTVLEGIYIRRTSWQKASEEAAMRNAAG